MVEITLDRVSVEFPIYNSRSRSLKNTLLNAATGGRIGVDAQGRTIVKGLDNISLRLVDGERLGLLGRNGAGKTTLLRVLHGIYAPSSGRVVVRGSVGSLIDVMFGVDPEASGRENILLRGALLGLSKSKIRDCMDEIIDFSELGPFLDIPVRTYSSGMQLRLGFAVSTVIRPQILLMDEWLSVGDEAFQKKASKRLESVVDCTRILVLASHSVELLTRICTRIVRLEHGTIVDAGDGGPIGAGHCVQAPTSVS